MLIKDTFLLQKIKPNFEPFSRNGPENVEKYIFSQYSRHQGVLIPFLFKMNVKLKCEPRLSHSNSSTNAGTDISFGQFKS